MTRPAMTQPLFVFVHGWGFGPAVWDGLRNALSEVERDRKSVV